MFKIAAVITGSFFIFLGVATANEVPMSEGEANLTLCSSCHGLNGNSPFPLKPNLAGQHADYIVNQLKAFKSGRRKNDTMRVICESLSNDEMLTLATYYSDQDPTIVGGNTLLIEKGKDMYSLCWSCHGENGEGPGSYPRIGGQHSQYTTQQLKNFQNGKRINPVMKAIASGLSVNEMEALGAYIASLNPQ